MQDRSKAIAYIFASAFGFALMAFFVRLTDEFGAPISSFQKSYFRNALAFLIAGAVFVRKHRHSSRAVLIGLAPRSAWPVLAVRSIVGTIGIFANFYALGRIQIADCQALNKTAPFFTVLFAWWFLGEKASLRQMLAMVLAMVGAVLIIRPGFDGSLTAGLIALSGGVAAGGAYTAVRKLGTMKVDGALIVLVFSGFSTLASVPFMAVGGFDRMTAMQLLTLLLAGASAAVGQFGITLAYRYAPPRSVAIFDYSNIFFTALLGMLFLGQFPDVLSWLGFAVIVAAAAALMASGKRD
jgi:drug/metabolite transporter (DMT)-like permease